MPFSKRERCSIVLQILSKQYPNSTCDLEYTNPYQLFVAVLLAARCTDELVNKVTKVFFGRFPQISDLVKASQSEVLAIIRDVTYAEAKAENLCQSAKIIENNGGEIPMNFDKLSLLPGIGRKSANTILAECFGIPTIAVDTHVICVSNRIGLSLSKNPLEVEKDLSILIQKNNWIMATHLLVAHGKRFCFANRPNCTQCAVANFCKYNLPDENQQMSLF